jgi:hypothetical protein
VANLNDTDGDGQVDKDDDDVSVTGGNPPGRNEIDLMKLVLEKPQNAPNGNARVRIMAGDVRIYKNGPEGKEQSKANGQAPGTIPLTDFTADSNGDGNSDIVLWVEARSASTMQGIQLAYEFQPAGGAAWVVLDRATATAVWVTASDTYYIRNTDAQFNPMVGPGFDRPELDDNARLVKRINNQAIAVDGTRYGAGNFFKDAAGTTDLRYGGRILCEFEVSPHGVERLGVRFDVTRQEWRGDGDPRVRPCRGGQRFPLAPEPRQGQRNAQRRY